jgi:hypothetical protein
MSESGAYSELLRTDHSGEDLRRADLSGAYLHGLIFCGVDLRDADLSGVDLTGANLSDVTWGNNQLANVQWPTHPDLRGADLRGVSMAGGRGLTGANMENAVLCGAHFVGVDLTSVNMKGADVDGADFRGCKMVQVVLEGAKNLEKAIFDPMPPIAAPRRAAPQASWMLRMVRGIVGADEDDADEEDFDDDITATVVDEAEVKEDDAEEDDDEQVFENPLTEEISLFDTLREGNPNIEEIRDKLQDTLAASVADLKDEAREKVQAKFKEMTDPAELLAKLEELGLIHQLKRAEKERAVLEPEWLKKLGDTALRPKVQFMLRTTPLLSQHKVYIEAKDLDRNSSGDAAKTELDIFRALIEDWFNVTATARNMSKHELNKFVESSYKKLARGGLVFGKQDLPAKLVESRETAIKVHKIESALTVKTKYVTRGLYQGLKAVLTKDTQSMNVDIKELDYLLGELAGLRVAITATTWDDVLDTWLSLANLPRKMRGERSQAILEQVFADEKLQEALGMANQLTAMVRGENGKDVPDGFLMRFKQDAGGHIKTNNFGFVKAINDEIGRINKIKGRQEAMFTTVQSALMAGLVTLGNYAVRTGYVPFGLGSDDDDEGMVEALLASSASY